MTEVILIVFLNQDFSNLDGVERRTLSDIVRYDPHIDSIGNGFVLADSSNESLVLSCRINGQWVFELFGIIHHHNPWSFRKDLSDFCLA